MPQRRMNFILYNIKNKTLGFILIQLQRTRDDIKNQQIRPKNRHLTEARLSGSEQKKSREGYPTLLLNIRYVFTGDTLSRY